MKCILMNKNQKVLLADYDRATGVFTKIYEVYDISYAPYILSSIYEDHINDDVFRTNLSLWFRGRGIPSWREQLDLLLHRLNITAPSELLDKAFGLSLRDQYWLKPFSIDVCYDDINFFDHDFLYSEFLEASLSKNSNSVFHEEALKTPNNTTDGMLKKAWIIEDGVRYLLKSGYKNELLQPFNEVLASEICKRLHFSHVPYFLDIYKDTVVSKCPCFITKDTEFVSAHQIMFHMKKFGNMKDYEEYIKVLENHGIKDARIKMENMYILDFLIMNEDRHLNNFGIIRDVNTLQWVDVAPIFDNGQSLNIKYYDEDEIHLFGEGRFFYEVRPFDEMIKVVKDIKRIDLSLLDGIVEWFDNLLHKYQYLTGFSDLRINRLCILLNEQIQKLKQFQEK